MLDQRSFMDCSGIFDWGGMCIDNIPDDGQKVAQFPLKSQAIEKAWLCAPLWNHPLQSLHENRFLNCTKMLFIYLTYFIRQDNFDYRGQNFQVGPSHLYIRVFRCACVRACVRAEFRVRKVVDAALTMMMKIKVIRNDELTPMTHSLPTSDPTWTQQDPKFFCRTTKILSIST